MGNAEFVYYPEPAVTSYRQTIDLQESLGELASDFLIDSAQSLSYTGRVFTTVSRITEIVRIQRDRMSGREDLAVQLMTLQSHLSRGHSTAFSANSDKSWGAYLTQPAKSGDTVINVSNNVFRTVMGANIISAGDYIILETENPALVYQIVKVESLTATASSAGTITLSNSLAFDFSGTVGVRYYRFWPYLKRPAAEVNSNMITNERGFLFSLDVNLIPDYHLYFDRLKPTEGDPEGEYNDNELTFTETDGSLLSQGGLWTYGESNDTSAPPVTEPDVPEITVGQEW